MKKITSKSAAVPLSTLKKVAACLNECVYNFTQLKWEGTGGKYAGVVPFARLLEEVQQYLPDLPVCTECGGSGFSDDLPDGDECLICDGDGFLR